MSGDKRRASLGGRSQGLAEQTHLLSKAELWCWLLVDREAVRGMDKSRRRCSRQVFADETFFRVFGQMTI